MEPMTISLSSLLKGDDNHEAGSVLQTGDDDDNHTQHAPIRSISSRCSSISRCSGCMPLHRNTSTDLGNEEELVYNIGAQVSAFLRDSSLDSVAATQEHGRKSNPKKTGLPKKLPECVPEDQEHEVIGRIAGCGGNNMKRILEDPVSQRMSEPTTSMVTPSYTSSKQELAPSSSGVGISADPEERKESRTKKTKWWWEKREERQKLTKYVHIFPVNVSQTKAHFITGRIIGTRGSLVKPIVALCPSARIRIRAREKNFPMRIFLSCACPHEFEVAKRLVAELLKCAFQELAAKTTHECVDVVYF